jgi:predicted HTH transcriptional regulator
MVPDELLDIIYYGRESRSLEYKQSLNWNDNEHKAKIVKSLLALANLMDGGYLVLGVEDGSFEPIGMRDEDYVLLNQDDIADHVKNYADPYLEFELNTIEDKGKMFAVFKVFAFEEVPVLCKRQYPGALRHGAIYTRSKTGKPETIEVPNHVEMREIISTAVEKGIRLFLEKNKRVGIGLSMEVITDDDKYDKELGGI